MKFEEWKFIGSIYSLETEKKIAVYNSWQTENARKIFFFYKNQDIRFAVHTDKFSSFKTTHENLCNCYVISHRFFPRFFNRDSNALVTYRRSKRNSIINNSGQSSLSSRDRRFEVLRDARDAARNIFLSLVSYPPGEKHPSILCVYNAESWETPLQQ